MLPLSSIPGFTLARRALLALLVDPLLKGIVISGPRGIGKSTLASGFVRFARRFVDPGSPVVTIPIGVDVGRLVGGIDLEQALATGTHVYQQGLLAAADGGLALVDDLDLMERSSLFEIAPALERGEVRCEREGLSRLEKSRFALIGTAIDGDGGNLSGFIDRIAFQVGEYEAPSADRTVPLIRRVESWRSDPEGFDRAWREKEERLAEKVIGARMLLNIVRVGDIPLEQLAGAAMMLGVSGSRGDIYAARGARAHAALRGSRVVEEIDVKFAVATILAPRSRNLPRNEPSAREPESRTAPSPGMEMKQDEQTLPPPGDDDNLPSGEPAEVEESRTVGGSGAGAADDDDERHFETLDFNGKLPEIEKIIASRIGRTGGRKGTRTGWSRGRHVLSEPSDVRGRSISIAATLRAAAPHQHCRRREETRRVIVRREDLRVKRFSQRTGTLFVFCVDASGSMASNRMREAKGAATRLLQDAYVKRDRVALIVFRGARAQLLLPPTPSIERAKRSLDILPTGGGTPLASALVTVLGVIDGERRRGHDRALVVILTDGRANVPMTESAAGMIMEARRRHVRSELERIAEAYRRGGVGTLVVDTKQSSAGDTDASRLATMLGGTHYHLPHINAEEIARVARESRRNTERSRKEV